MSEVDLKSKGGCFLPKSPQIVLGIQVIYLTSTWGHFCTKWGRIRAGKNLRFFKKVFRFLGF